MFITELFEDITAKHAAFCFGRMNPPTVGHAQLINTVAKASQGGDYFVFVSQTQDSKKNPLDYATKVKFIKALFPDQASHIVYALELKTIMQVAEWLYNAGYRTVTFAAGSDRLDSFKKLLTDYNGKEGGNVYYKFDTINFVSSGDRDPDADGIAGVSASSAREAASQGDLAAFAQATGAGKLAPALYQAVRKGMLLDTIAEDERKTNPKILPLSKKANIAFPYAKDETEALALYILDREEKDVNKLTDLEHDLERQIADLQQQIDDIKAKRSDTFEDAAGVGVVATNRKMAKDPRYSTSMTVDVHPDTPRKNARAFKLI